MEIPKGFMLTMDGKLEPVPAYQPNPNKIGLLEISAKETAKFAGLPPTQIQPKPTNITDAQMADAVKKAGEHECTPALLACYIKVMKNPEKQATYKSQSAQRDYALWQAGKINTHELALRAMGRLHGYIRRK